MKKLQTFFCILSFVSMTYANNVNNQCQRIISISPTITDTLFSLGLNDHIIGGTRYDRLPKNSHIKIIGGSLDPNYEAIIMLAPSLILADVTEDSPQKRKLDNLKLPTELLAFSTIEEIQNSLQKIGQLCGIEETTNNKIHELNQTIAQIKREDALFKALIMYTYEGDDHLNQLPQRAAGKSFHQDMLEAINIQNAYQGSINAPIISAESLLMMSPDVIILLEGDSNYTLDPKRTILIEKVTPQWANLQGLSAIQNNQVYFVKGEATFIASPDAVIATLKSWHSIFKNY